MIENLMWQNYEVLLLYILIVIVISYKYLLSNPRCRKCQLRRRQIETLSTSGRLSLLIQRCVTPMIFLGSMDQASFIDLTNWNFSMQLLSRRSSAISDDVRVALSRLAITTVDFLPSFNKRKMEWMNEMIKYYSSFDYSLHLYKKIRILWNLYKIIKSFSVACA